MNKLILLLLLMLPSLAFPADLHIGASATGNESGSDGSNLCTLTYANANLTAGNTGYLYDTEGSYTSDYIAPANSGTLTDRITYVAQTGDSPVVTGQDYGVLLDGDDYIVIDGIEISNSPNLVRIIDGSDYNEIKNCSIHTGTGTTQKGVWVYGTSTHNWIHDNTIYEIGLIDASCQDTGYTLNIGTDTGDDSNYNTIEDNTIYRGGHFVLRSETYYNVVRNNFIYNDCWMAETEECTPDESPGCSVAGGAENYYGNRGINIYDANDAGRQFNLVESNRVGDTAYAPDGGGSDGLTGGGPGVIFRYNIVYNSYQRGFYPKQYAGSGGDDERIYNNTFFHCGHQGALSELNNPGGLSFAIDFTDVKIINNLFWDNYDDEDINNYDVRCVSGCENRGNYLSTDADPLFIDETIAASPDKFDPDLTLRANSPVINSGTYLTTVHADDTDTGTSLIVADALYFQDGTWGSSLSSVQADWIAVGTVDNVVQISSINYGTNTITISESISRSEDDAVWLYKDSGGTLVLYGSAPDQGAYEWTPPTGASQYGITDSGISHGGS